MTRRTGRGRLSSIELLPPDAQSIVDWALQELRERKHTQLDILDKFNSKLRRLAVDTGQIIAPISLSAFNRYSLRLATTARRLEETREIANALTERLKPGDTDDLTILTAETIKTLIFELLESGDGIDTKGTMELARALQSAVSAQNISSERRQKVEKEYADKAAKAIDKVAKLKGLSAETVEQIKAKILGVSK